MSTVARSWEIRWTDVSLSFFLFGVRLGSLAPGGPFEQRGSQSRLNFLSFALPILSLYSYANRLLVKTKWRWEKNGEKERGRQDGPLSKSPRNNSFLSFFFFIVDPQFFLSLRLFLFSLLVLFFFFLSFLRDTRDSVQLLSIFQWQINLKSVYEKIVAI